MTIREAIVRRRTRMVVGMLPVIVIVVGIAWLAGAFEGKPASVYVVCEDCGLSAAETDDLINVMRESGRVQTRAELLAGYAATFDDLLEDGSVPCDDCADAVLDAAGS